MEFIQDEFLNSENIESEFNNQLIDNALHYARLGYPVFPLHNIVREIIEGIEITRCSCWAWRVCRSQGKHPRTLNGFKDATTDENIIIDWWEKHPAANIGLRTGIESGIFVLDIDRKHGGEHSLEALQDYYRVRLGDKFEPLPGTLMTFTGGLGRHLYYKFPVDLRDIRNSESKIDKGLDIRANGGFIVAPPSNHLSGREYQWHGVNTPIEDAPDWLIFEVLEAEENCKQKGKASSSTIVRNDGKIKEGDRNSYIFRQACGLANSFSKEEVLRRCLIKNEADLEEPLNESEIKRIVKSVYKNYVKYKRPNYRVENMN